MRAGNYIIILSLILVLCFFTISTAHESNLTIGDRADTTLYTNWNISACSVTDTAPFTLSNASTVTKIKLWLDTNKSGTSGTFTITGTTSISGTFTSGACDSNAKNWCEAVITINKYFEAGSYTLKINSLSLCHNSQSNNKGFIIVYGSASPTPTPTPDTSSSGDCTSTLSDTLSLHIPYLSFADKYYALDMNYAYFNNDEIVFKVTGAKNVSMPSCQPATLSSELKMKIPALTVDTDTYWIDLKYDEVHSILDTIYFKVTNYGKGGQTEGDLKTKLTDYNNIFSNLVTANDDFVKAANEWESANFSKLSATELKTLVNKYLETGDKLASNLNLIVDKAKDIAQTKNVSYLEGLKMLKDNVSDTVIDVLPDIGNGVSPGLAKSLGDLISETKGEVKEIQKRYDQGLIDDITYNDAMNKLKVKSPLKGVGMGFSAVMAAAGGYVVQAGVLSAQPQLVAIGGGIIAGAITGMTVYWIWTKCTGTNKNGPKFLDYDRELVSKASQEECLMSSGNVEAGKPIPIPADSEGTLTISVPGYTPIVIKNLTPPANGKQLDIDFKPVPVDQVKSGDKINITYTETSPPAKSCTDIVTISAAASPQNPGPNETVTVTATVLPSIAGCTVSYKVNGTDGYTASGSPTTDSQGKISFKIPGGSENVFDKVVVESNSKSYTVTYTF